MRVTLNVASIQRVTDLKYITWSITSSDLIWLNYCIIWRQVFGLLLRCPHPNIRVSFLVLDPEPSVLVMQILRDTLEFLPTRKTRLSSWLLSVSQRRIQEHLHYVYLKRKPVEELLH